MKELYNIYEEMKAHGLKVPPEKVKINVHNANTILHNTMKYFLGKEGKKLVWLPQYDDVAKWLEDNQGRGLFLYGSCGLGKTFITRYAIPGILLEYCNKVVSAFDMSEANADPDKILSKHILAIDDIGTEETAVRFGEKRAVVPEILDATEKYGKLLIMTSNLDGKELIQKYGNRTIDRMIAVTRRIEFKGESFRA